MTPRKQSPELVELREAIYGNGKPGLKTEMALVKATVDRIEKWMYVIGTAIVLFVLNEVLGLIKTPAIVALEPVPQVSSSAEVRASTLPFPFDMLPSVDVLELKAPIALPNVDELFKQ